MTHVCWKIIRFYCRVAHIRGACAYFPLSNLWNCNILACSVWSSGWNRTHSESIFQFWRIWKRIDDRKTISYIWYMQIFLVFSWYFWNQNWSNYLPAWTDIQKWSGLGHVTWFPKLFEFTTQSGMSLSFFVAFASIKHS